jgi:hypothetical protein
MRRKVSINFLICIYKKSLYIIDIEYLLVTILLIFFFFNEFKVRHMIIDNELASRYIFNNIFDPYIIK